MINNNIYAILIGVGDYKKIKITDLPSYRMDVALIGTGLISSLKCTQEHIEQSLDMFAGHGIAVYASSADDEVSRLGPNGNHSMFTGTLSSAMISPSIVHKGQIALEDIYRETQRLVHAWNIKNHGKEQHPIYRSSERKVVHMRKGSFGQYLAIFFVVIGVFYCIGAISDASEPKCIKAGCDNKQASGSSYCYLHKPYTSKSSSYSGSSYSGSSKSSRSSSYSGSSKSSSSTTKSTSGNYSSSGSSSSKKTGTTTKSNSSKSKYNYNSYDDGYDDIYMDGDYDYDRYDRDSDYAEGVDDAMEEYGEDW